MRRGRPEALPGGPGERRPAGIGGAEEQARTAGPAVRGPGDQERGSRGGEREAARLWHVTLSVSGRQTPVGEIRRGLEQLAQDHPFLLAGRYAEDRAEIRYWEEARDLHDAAAVALRLWGEHRATARLPAWEIVGLEVVGRETYHRRIAEGRDARPAFPGGVRPF
ncbi:MULTISPECIES: hypothetical protein [Streptomyces]|uniref:Uncharacterized protein n=1 Tax=Streptomyces lycii TaxID=2654337 RepID=A0ABQ7FLJ5_9ACTN|nr:MULTISPECIES: hypothetical protein [Streptomyces]KAF4409555.1 hypothetical protein GCU69_08340 [Streptomyces lycii]PGH50407.1 hypothetical protein CRI70_12205 [Streptomyces sp. Ru87]